MFVSMFVSTFVFMFVCAAEEAERKVRPLAATDVTERYINSRNHS